MPTLDLQLVFDDTAIEDDFYVVNMKPLSQDFLNSLGGTKEAIQAATKDDERKFVLKAIAQNVINDYFSKKIQQQTQTFQQTLFDSVKETLKTK